MGRWLPLANSISSGLVTVLATLGVQYPEWTWVPIAAGAVSMINLHVIPSLSQAYPPKVPPPSPFAAERAKS